MAFFPLSPFAEEIVRLLGQAGFKRTAEQIRSHIAGGRQLEGEPPPFDVRAFTEDEERNICADHMERNITAPYRFWEKAVVAFSGTGDVPADSTEAARLERVLLRHMAGGVVPRPMGRYAYAQPIMDLEATIGRLRGMEPTPPTPAPQSGPQGLGSPGEAATPPQDPDEAKSAPKLPKRTLEGLSWTEYSRRLTAQLPPPRTTTGTPVVGKNEIEAFLRSRRTQPIDPGIDPDETTSDDTAPSNDEKPTFEY